MNLADLSNSKFDEVTFDVEIEHPVAGATGIVIQIIGLHSEKVRAVRDRQANAMLKQTFATQRGKAVPTVKEGTQRNAELLAAATVDWFERELDVPVGQKPKITKGIEWEGSRLQFSEAEAEKLYSDPNFDWLAKQVDEAVGELANFMKP